MPLASLETYLLQLYLVSPSIPKAIPAANFLPQNSVATFGAPVWAAATNPKAFISPSLAMKLTAIVTLLVGANALELTKVWKNGCGKSKRKRQFIPYTKCYWGISVHRHNIPYIYISHIKIYQRVLWYQESWDEKTAGKSEARRYPSRMRQWITVWYSM